MTQLEKKQRKQSSVIATGAKTARPCDSCLHSRARWYCAADDAFLCQRCDSSIHSANALAHRHERVRLKVSSSSSSVNIEHNHVVVDDEDGVGGGNPTWHRGFKRKARTPRGGGKENLSSKSTGRRIGAVVPELGTPSSSSSSDVEECSAFVEEEEERHLLLRVPVFNTGLNNFQPATGNADTKRPDVIITSLKKEQSVRCGEIVNDLPAFLATEMDLGEFEIDMETLLGRGFDENPFSIEELGLMDSPEGGSSGIDELSPTQDYGTVKQEEEEMYIDNDLTDVKFDCGSPWTGEEMTDEDNKVTGVAVVPEGKKAKIMLRLNYDAVITEWSSQGSPWANGQKPVLDSNDSFLDFMGMVYVGGGVGEFQGGTCVNNNNNTGVGLPTASANAAADGGREARVSRYREKRRTRLFSKKIRYEVRKLNAEKRPRMKGRFVKRTSSATSTTTVNVAARANALASSQFAYC